MRVRGNGIVAVLIMVMGWMVGAGVAWGQSAPAHDHAAMLKEMEAQGGAAGGTVGAGGQPRGFLERLTEVYVPREVCMNYEQDVKWTHVASDVVIAAAYYSIPLALVYFVRRRKDVAFGPMFYLFAAFILACGTTHVFSVIAIWHPYYRLDGLVKGLTALVSILTAIMLWPLIPKALLLPSPAQLQMANTKLQGEVAERVRVETELRLATANLESRVKERTEDLERTNGQLREEVSNRRAAEAEREKLLKREREARAESDRASRTKDVFLATLSHELRTPINAILGWTQLLRSGREVTGEDVKEGLEIIERNSRVQVKLIEDLLDMSRVVSGKLRLEVTWVDMREVIKAAVDTVMPAADAKEIRIEMEMDGEGSIMGDAGRLQQVVWNLLSNAVKFTPRGGRVEVRLERVAAGVEIRVSDTGQGIKPEFLPHVFERFQQQDSSMSRRHGGLGLGLAIVRHLTELHGGWVRAESDGDGKGATFVVALPTNEASVRGAEEDGREALPEEQRAALGWPGLGGVRVLVVDDEPDARELVRRVLERRGASVLVAGSGREAMERLAESRPTVMVVDIGMPDEDGYMFIKLVRALAPGKGGLVPAVALTAFARPEDRHRVLQAGFQAHVAKPAEARDLALAVANLAGVRFGG